MPPYLARSRGLMMKLVYMLSRRQAGTAITPLSEPRAT